MWLGICTRIYVTEWKPKTVAIFLDCLNDIADTFGYPLHIHAVKRNCRSRMAQSRVLFLCLNNWLRWRDLVNCVLVSQVVFVYKIMSSRIRKSQLVFAHLRHLRHRRDIRLSIRGRVHAAAIRSVVLCGSGATPMRPDVQILEHRFLLSIGSLWWENFLSNSDFLLMVLSPRA